MDKIGIKIRNANSLDVDEYIRWGKLEGWNMGLHDLPPNYKDYHGGWFVAEAENSIIQGLLYCVKYPTGVGHIGYLIVDQHSRGLGIGSNLIKHSIEYLSQSTKDNVNGLVSLYSGDEEIPFYQKLGFNVADKVIRLICTQETNHSDLREIKNSEFTTSFINPVNDVMEICNLDAKLSGAYRQSFWKLFGDVISATACVVCRSTLDGQLLGFGATRPFMTGWKIGPVYAQSEIMAQTIVTRLITSNNLEAGENSPFIADIFNENEPAMKIFSSLGFKFKFDAYLLVKTDATSKIKVVPSSENVDKIYSITSLDFN